MRGDMRPGTIPIEQHARVVEQLADATAENERLEKTIRKTHALLVAGRIDEARGRLSGATGIYGKHLRSIVTPSRIVIECCRQCRRKLGDWHDKDCSVGSMGPGRVAECPAQHIERTVYVATDAAAVERAERAVAHLVNNPTPQDVEDAGLAVLVAFRAAGKTP